jgi:hypothetical protein
MIFFGELGTGIQVRGIKWCKYSTKIFKLFRLFWQIKSKPNVSEHLEKTVPLAENVNTPKEFALFDLVSFFCSVS